LNLILDPSLELGFPPQVRIDESNGRRIRVFGKVLIPKNTGRTVSNVSVVAKVIGVNDAIPSTVPPGSVATAIVDPPPDPDTDPDYETRVYKFTDDAETPPKDRRPQVGQDGFRRLVVWATVDYRQGQPDVCISQTCLQFEAVTRNAQNELAPIEQFSVSKPLPPFVSNQPNKYDYTTVNNVNKLCECLATADRRSSGIIKVGAKIFSTSAAAQAATLPSPIGAGSIDGWWVVDYKGQAQSSVKFRNDLYNNVLTDNRIPEVNNGVGNYLVVIAVFLSKPNDWVEAFNARRTAPLQFEGGFKTACSP
jgi:hypothetical protein